MNFKKHLNKPASAAIIIVAALVIPAWFIRELGILELKATPASVFVAALYIVVVIGFVFFAFGKRGSDLTSAATDAKVSASYAKAAKKVRPAFLAAAGLCLLWAAYLAWSLKGNA